MILNGLKTRSGSYGDEVLSLNLEAKIAGGRTGNIVQK